LNYRSSRTIFCTDDIKPLVETMNEAERRLGREFPTVGKLEVAERIQRMATFAPDAISSFARFPTSKGCSSLRVTLS